MWVWIISIFRSRMKTFIRTFWKHYQKQIQDNPEFLERLKFIIIGIDDSHPDWKWSTKLEFASDAGLEAAREYGLDVARSLVNSTLELIHLELDPPKPPIPMPETKEET